MKLDSPLFDSIRVKPENDRRRTPQDENCEWPGCEGFSTHRAPKGRGKEGQYWRFCLDHVREYNHSYNFFAGMADDAVATEVCQRFDAVLVDEYQDTNALQAEILRRIKPDGRGVTVVGDDAQSIYSFCGATVRNILDFPG